MFETPMGLEAAATSRGTGAVQQKPDRGGLGPGRLLLLSALWLAAGCASGDNPAGDAGADLQPLPDQAVDRARHDAAPDSGGDADLPRDLTPDQLPALAPPTASPAPGSYPYGTEISLSAASGAVIHYTLNGGLPDATSPIYSTPIRLTGRSPTLTVQALAVAPEKESSPVASFQYSLQPGIIVHFKKPDSWSQATIHYWASEPDGLESSWPGVPMTAEGNGWYTYSLAGQSALNLVFSDSGQPQTGDLRLDRPEGWFWGEDLWDIDPEHFARFSFPQGKPRALVMSFDDGNLQDKQLIALFEANGIRGTFHLNSGLMSQPDKVPAAEVAATYAGHEVSAHSVTHPYLDSLDQAGLEAEVLADKQSLEALVGTPVVGLSYPFGSYNQLLLELMPSWGLIYGRVVPSTGDFRLPHDLLRWRGSGHHSEGQSLASGFFSASSDRPLLLLIWGHSWELDDGGQNNSWQYMESLCQYLGHRPDVWYATMSEVAQYLTALRQVSFSLTGDLVQNSSALSVWVKQGGQAVELPPGGTLPL